MTLHLLCVYIRSLIMFDLVRELILTLYSRFSCDLLNSGRGVEGFFVRIANPGIPKKIRLNGATLAPEDVIYKVRY